MKKCPNCGEFSVTFDGYRGVERCLIDGCTCIVIDEKSHSILKRDSKRNVMKRVKIEDGVEKETLKTYDLEV